MSVFTKLKAEEVKLLSNPETLEYVEKYIERIKSETGSTPPLALRVLEYLRKFSKIPRDHVSEVRSNLEKLGLKEESVIMIMNICPKNTDDLKTILQVEEKILEQEFLEKIISIIKDHCSE
jgi:DNA-directed RNA polymerase subunit F